MSMVMADCFDEIVELGHLLGLNVWFLQKDDTAAGDHRRTGRKPDSCGRDRSCLCPVHPMRKLGSVREFISCKYS